MANPRISVEIVRETPKAKLVKAADGRQAWMQSRWVREDLTVAEATFAKNAAELAAKQDREQARRDFRDSMVEFEIARQTEKGVAALLPVEFAGSEDQVVVWFPKSQGQPGEAEGRAKMPGWLVERKIEEAIENFRPSGGYAAHRFCKGERPIVLGGLI